MPKEKKTRTFFPSTSRNLPWKRYSHRKTTLRAFTFVNTWDKSLDQSKKSSRSLTNSRNNSIKRSAKRKRKSPGNVSERSNSSSENRKKAKSNSSIKEKSESSEKNDQAGLSESSEKSDQAGRSRKPSGSKEGNSTSQPGGKSKQQLKDAGESKTSKEQDAHTPVKTNHANDVAWGALQSPQKNDATSRRFFSASPGVKAQKIRPTSGGLMVQLSRKKSGQPPQSSGIVQEQAAIEEIKEPPPVNRKNVIRHFSDRLTGSRSSLPFSEHETIIQGFGKTKRRLRHSSDISEVSWEEPPAHSTALFHLEGLDDDQETGAVSNQLSTGNKHTDSLVDVQIKVVKPRENQLQKNDDIMIVNEDNVVDHDDFNDKDFEVLRKSESRRLSRRNYKLEGLKSGRASNGTKVTATGKRAKSDQVMSKQHPGLTNSEIESTKASEAVKRRSTRKIKKLEKPELENNSNIGKRRTRSGDILSEMDSIPCTNRTMRHRKKNLVLDSSDDENSTENVGHKQEKRSQDQTGSRRDLGDDVKSVNRQGNNYAAKSVAKRQKNKPSRKSLAECQIADEDLAERQDESGESEEEVDLLRNNSEPDDSRDEDVQIKLPPKTIRLAVRGENRRTGQDVTDIDVALNTLEDVTEKFVEEQTDKVLKQSLKQFMQKTQADLRLLATQAREIKAKRKAVRQANTQTRKIQKEVLDLQSQCNSLDREVEALHMTHTGVLAQPTLSKLRTDLEALITRINEAPSQDELTMISNGKDKTLPVECQKQMKELCIKHKNSVMQAWEERLADLS